MSTTKAPQAQAKSLDLLLRLIQIDLEKLYHQPGEWLLTDTEILANLKAVRESYARSNVLDAETRDRMESVWNTMGNPNLEKLASGLVNTHPLILNNMAYSLLSAVSAHMDDGRIQQSVKEAAGAFFTRQHLISLAYDIKMRLGWNASPKEKGEGILRAIEESGRYKAEHTCMMLDREITLKAIRGVAKRLAEERSEDTELDLGTIEDYCRDWCR